MSLPLLGIPPNAFHSYRGKVILGLQILPSGKHVCWVVECVNVPWGFSSLPGVLKLPKIDPRRFKQLNYDSLEMEICMIFEFVA
jgi:hypothetical protein